MVTAVLPTSASVLTKSGGFLARIALDEWLSVREALSLMDLQERIIAAKRSSRQERLERVDWKESYASLLRLV